MWFIDLFKKKDKMKVSEKSNNNISTVSFIALKERELPDKYKLKKYLEDVFDIKIFINNWKEDVGTIDIEDKQIIITLMPCRINWEELNQCCERAWYFNEAREKLRCHVAHLVVSINGAKGEQVKNCILLSKVITAIIESTNTIGVYWYNSQTIRSPEEFKDKVLNLNENNLPIELWIDIRFRINGSFKGDIYTVGMDKLGLRNVEVLNSKLDFYILYVFIYEISLNMASNLSIYKENEILEAGKFNFKVKYRNGTISDSKEIIELVSV